MSVKSLLTPEQHQFLYDEYHEFLAKVKVDSKKYHLRDFFEVLRQKDDEFKEFTDKELSNKIIASRRLDGSEHWPNLSDVENYVSPYVCTLAHL